MNNRVLTENALEELYIRAIMTLIEFAAGYGEDENLSLRDIYTEAMMVFPEGLEPEDEESFFDRKASGQLDVFFAHARERLSREASQP